MTLTLHRIYLGDAGTLGVLEIAGQRFWTLEDRAGDFGKGCCVPEGVYTLEPHSGTRFKDTWALVGPGVAHWPTPEAGDREAVLLHVGNTLADTEGCILVGTGMLLDRPMLLGSRQGFEVLRAILREQSGALTLRIQRG